ncbi:helix-turn-helix domain-containing protein [Pseudoalteromonas sp. DL2-H2.2]|uniref:helix-turn-helix transcriptional regulator n=1 Tax=Pseudoalteromonas sp. DL2-H2.2 TaxID=2908889 RepID=UPI001F4536D6|nr:helix-turn-helix transcriptional regulator [Pseudoalteromonas sp. DL2-H2.2]MCF2908908.1 helix-turn-helix domain-containing protein [Pseudoalteromonas sp. DL2-H2.2]
MKNSPDKRNHKVENFRRYVQRSIRQLRLHRGWSQQELARRLGVDQATISNYESGKTDMSYAQMFELFLVFGKDLTGVLKLTDLEEQSPSPDEKPEKE